MKRLLCLCAMAVMCSAAMAKGRSAEAASGQPLYKYEFNVGYATFPVWAASVHTFWGSQCDMPAPSIAAKYGSVGNLYGEYTSAEYLTGVISAEFSARFKKWFALSVQANFCGVVRNVHSGWDGKKTGVDNDYVMSFLPYAKFTYLNRPIVYMYSAIGIGMTMSFDGKGSGIYNLDPAFQITPVGVAVGKNLYGFFELGLGMVYCGCKAGIGYRF
ncbi:MAG: hypothetical protein NC115_06730 [Bacteroidales bacterium]|nr:hypothetical protein [Bacteroides sp.]MCM1197628.1 hypothetical protein [Clostridium sp.]MCM1502347.1 hypothetical protein [Bacteroidales bacterium]